MDEFPVSRSFASSRRRLRCSSRRQEAVPLPPSGGASVPTSRAFPLVLVPVLSPQGGTRTRPANRPSNAPTHPSARVRVGVRVPPPHTPTPTPAPTPPPLLPSRLRAKPTCLANLRPRPNPRRHRGFHRCGAPKEGSPRRQPWGRRPVTLGAPEGRQNSRPNLAPKPSVAPSGAGSALRTRTQRSRAGLPSVGAPHLLRLTATWTTGGSAPPWHRHLETPRPTRFKLETRPPPVTSPRLRASIPSARPFQPVRRESLIPSPRRRVPPGLPHRGRNRPRSPRRRHRPFVLVLPAAQGPGHPRRPPG